MSSRGYKSGANREQTMLLPPSIEEYISETNTVRAIDIYVESLNLAAMNFSHTDGGSELGGGPAYHPKVLLKLYLYGYLNRIRSSRRLEHEARINLEMIWLLEGLKPSHATIANFRKDNLEGIKIANCDFTQLCRELDLFGRTEVGIDGTFLSGNASKASIHTKEKLEQQLAKLNQDLDEYLAQLEKNDQTESDILAEDKELANKIERLKVRQAQTQARLEKSGGDTQVSETDPQARLLSKRGQTVAGYNVQIAVDSKNKLIVCNEVVNEGNDSQQLAAMAIKAKETLGVEHLEVDADSGYDNREQIKTCLEAGITP
jgi:transposase